MSAASPTCTSCGYNHISLPGRTCTRKTWHKPITEKSPMSRALQEEYRHTQGSYIPNWVAARLRVEAFRRGKTAGALSAEILINWANKAGGRP